MDQSLRQSHNELQRRYYEDVERPRIAIADTPYVRRHVDKMVELARLDASSRILELGAGLGKFTIPLVARGLTIVANDLSPVLLQRLGTAARGAVETVACDAAEIDRHVDTSFDRVIGFFVLHHFIDFEGTFRALMRILKPGGLVAFCEPVGTNPLYPLQVLFTPTMSFAGEPSLMKMRRGFILPLLERAGFVDAASHAYGYFPPVLKNTVVGDRVEQWLERRAWVPFPHAFQIFVARRPE